MGGGPLLLGRYLPEFREFERSNVEPEDRGGNGGGGKVVATFISSILSTTDSIRLAFWPLLYNDIVMAEDGIENERLIRFAN